MRGISCLLLCLLCVAAPAGATSQNSGPRFSDPAPPEWVHIDGSKNPELIPEWSIWQRGFLILARSAELPTVILRQFTPEELELLKRETAEELRRDAVCQRRVLDLRPLLATERMRVIDERTKAIQLECRQDTLDAHDRLLARLRSEAQFALTDWMEALRTGTRVSIPRKELPHYLKPR